MNIISKMKKMFMENNETVVTTEAEIVVETAPTEPETVPEFVPETEPEPEAPAEPVSDAPVASGESMSKTGTNC